MATFEAIQQALTGLPRVEGVTAVDIMKLPAPLDVTLRKMLKEPLSLDAVAAEIQMSKDETSQLMDILVERGFVKSEDQSDHGGLVYKIYLARTRRLNLPASLDVL